MKKHLKSNSNIETHYYPQKHRKLKNIFFIIVLLLIIVLFLVFFFSNKKTIEFSFDNIANFKECKERHSDYYKAILESDIDAVEKSSQRRNVDSLYFFKNIDLLNNKRTEISNSSSTFSTKLYEIQTCRKDYDSNKLNIEKPINSSNLLEDLLKNYDNDLNYYQFEVNWCKRIIESDDEIKNILNREAKSSLDGIYREIVFSQKLEIIDSSIVKNNRDVKHISYKYEVDKQYQGVLGKYKYSGIIELDVKLEIGKKMTINIIKNNAVDKRL